MSAAHTAGKVGRPARGAKLAAYYAARPELVEANRKRAALEAAAPELLAALKEAAQPGGLSERDYIGWLYRARSIINRAEASP